MLIKKQITDNIVRYYSDSGKYIRRVEDGRLFAERDDVVGGKWTYEETDSYINEQPQEDEQ